MKKSKFLVFATALIAVGTLFFVSCSKDDDSSDYTGEEEETEVDEPLELVLNSNVPAKFEVEGQAAVTGTEATYTDFKNSSMKVTVTAVDPAYNFTSNKQQMTAKLTGGNTDMDIDFFFAKGVSDIQVAQDAAKGHSVTNDAWNAKEFGQVSVDIPSNVSISGNTADAFSVVAGIPYEEPVETDDAQTGDTEVDITTLVMKFTPDNAQFSPSLPVKVYIDEEEAGETYSVEGKDYVVDDKGYITFEAPHFSTWTKKGNLYYNKKTAKTNTAFVDTVYHTFTDKEIDNQFAYRRYVGWDQLVKVGGNKTYIINKRLKKLVNRAWKKKPSKYKRFIHSYTPKFRGPGRVRIKQSYTDYTVVKKKGSSRKYYIRVWGKVSFFYAKTSGHSGGSGQ